MRGTSHVITEQKCFIRKLLSHAIKSYQPVILTLLVDRYFWLGASDIRDVTRTNLTSHTISCKRKDVCLVTQHRILRHSATEI
jgi:hypothetical protein